jgi:HPt (histidine-containing phosphotransfer) domain-containing protein
MAQGLSIDELLAAARSEFALRLPAKVGDLEAHAASEAWPDLRLAAHKLRGSAATYGFPAMSALAASIEDILLAAALAPGPDAVGRIGAAVTEARAEAERVSRESR